MDEHLLEVYLINTARHTEETPVAEWVSLPTDAETMKAVFGRLGVDGSDTEQYQVSAFHTISKFTCAICSRLFRACVRSFHLA